MRRLPLIAVAVVALVAAGCTGGEADTESALAPLTDTELGWVRGYSAWTYEVLDDEFGTDAHAGVVRACARRLDEVGAAPTDRLRAAAEAAAAICPLLGRDGARRRAYAAVYAADDLVLPLFLDEQELELRDGATTKSRADGRLSAVASADLDEPVEVRCWSPQDWLRVGGEDNAWTDDDTRIEELAGWADPVTDRIHLRLNACNALARLSDRDVESWSDVQRSQAADALGTLSHEIHHFVLPDAEEAKVECEGIRAMASLGVQLDLDEEAAKALEDTYREEVYPDLPTEYNVGGCPRR